MARLSRRKVVAGLGAAPLLAHGALANAALADPVLVLCAHYGDLLRRRDALMRAWGDHHNWFQLSKAEQRTVPEGQMLAALDDEFDRCVREGVRVMRRLRSVPARTIAGATAKLSVVAEFIEPGDYPAAHRVLLSAIADLRAMKKD